MFLDINECELSTSECEQKCDNLPGRYNCYCFFGYQLRDDRHTCEHSKLIVLLLFTN